MELLNDPIELVTVLGIIVVFVAVLVGHLGLAFRTGLRHPWNVAWKRLLAQSVVMQFVWLGLAFVISIMNLLDAPRSDPAGHTYAVTFGLPYDWTYFGNNFHFDDSSVPPWAQILASTIAVIAFLFVLALPACALGRAYSHRRLGEPARDD